MMEPAAHWQRRFEHHQVPASLAGPIEEMAHGPQVLINEMTAPPNEPSIRGISFPILLMKCPRRVSKKRFLWVSAM